MNARKILSGAMALLLAASLPLGALAQTYDLADGSITVEARSDGHQYVSQDGVVKNEKQTTETVIIQDKSTSSTTTNTITITAKKNRTADVTISGVDIDVSNTGSRYDNESGEAAISTGGDGKVTIELEGENTLKSGMYRAGLEKNNSGRLTVEDTNNNGSLTVIGGKYGAGIGSGYDNSDDDFALSSVNAASNIVIDGGKIEVAGGTYGAGIGGTTGGAGTNITIKSGTVTATGGEFAAAIGGGHSGNGENITIEKGTVTANGGYFASGIGGGAAGDGNNITIKGGNVIANGNELGAAIGGGGEGNGSNITISGGKVEANGGSMASGIGSGSNGSGTDIKVSGNAQVKVAGGTCPDIGGEKNGEIIPDTSGLGANGSIAYFPPDANKFTTEPEKLLHKTDAGNVEIHEQVTIKSNTATCRFSGIIIYECSCGEEIRQNVSAMGHDLEHHDAKAATCTEKGWAAYETCTRCDYTTRGTDIPALEHETEYHPAKAATCTEKGWAAYDTCKRCSYSTYVEEPINSNNHDLKHHDAKAATCTEKGWAAYDTCTRCNYTTRGADIPALNHSFTDYVYQQDASCLKDGTEIAHCDRTGCTATDERTAKGTALGHSFTDYVYQQDASCLKDGTEIAHCDHPGCTETDERTAKGTALGHSFTDYVYQQDASYEADGTETAHCDNGCGATDTRTKAGSSLPIYHVTDENGSALASSRSESGSVLTITVNQANATLSGTTAGLRVLQARGITTVVFVTTSATSTFEISDLLPGTAYTLTHSGTAVGFTLDGKSVLSILK